MVIAQNAIFTPGRIARLSFAGVPTFREQFAALNRLPGYQVIGNEFNDITNRMIFFLQKV